MTKENNKKMYIGIFVTCLSFKLLSYMCATNVSLISDHIGDLALPAYQAGYDWSYLVSLTSYYGYGIKWLYTPLFWLSDNPYFIYMAIKLIYVILESFMAVGIFHFFTKYWGMKKDVITATVSIVPAVIASVSVNSEAALFMGFYIFMFFITLCIQNLENKKKLRIYSVLTAFWMNYMLTLHERCIAIFIAFATTLVIYKIATKKWFIELKSFIPTMAVIYFLQELLTDFVVNFFWGTANELGTLKNTTVSIKNPTWFLSSFDNFKILFAEVFSNLYTLGVKTYGFSWLAIVILFMGIIWLFINKKEAGQYIEKNGAPSAVLAISAFTVVIILGGVALRYGRTLSLGRPYGYKGFTYHRYYLVFAWPGVMAVVHLWRNMDANMRKLLRTLTAILTLASTVLFFCYTYRTLSREYAIESNIKFDRLGYFTDISSVDITTNIFLSVFLMLGFLGLFMVRKKICAYIYIAVLGILMFFVKSHGLNIDLPSVECKSFGNSYAFICELEEYMELPKEMYCPVEISDPWTAQFMLREYSIYDYWPEGESNIIFSCVGPEYISERYRKDLTYVELDTNEYVFFVGDKYNSVISNMGYTANSYN